MIWLKTLGVACIISGFGSYGLMGAHKIEKRVEQIKVLRLSMGFLEKEIIYMQSPLPIAMQRTAQLTSRPVRVLFEECSRHLRDRQGISIGEAWNRSLKRLSNSSDLNHDDIEIVRAVSSRLGASGIEDQKKLFQMIQEELVIQENNARDNLQSGRKLWGYGGFILGITIVLLLL